MAGPPIVELGFSVELEEELSGVRQSGGYEVTVPGLTEWGKELAELGLGELGEAHKELLESLVGSSEELWERFIGSSASDLVLALDEFLGGEEGVRDLAWQFAGGTPEDILFTAYRDFMATKNPLFVAGLWAARVNIRMTMFFFQEVLPFVDDWIDAKDRELDRKIDKNLEREKEGGGSAADDGVEDDIEDAVDDFFDETDQDDFQPEDVDDFADDVDEIEQDLDEIDADLRAIDPELAGGEAGSDLAAELAAEIRALRKTLVETRAGLARPLARMGEWERMR
jgi:hypothetical protein